MTILDFHQLAQIMNTSETTIRKNWRRYPHFFIGSRRNLKSARFVLEQLVEALSRECVQESIRENMDREVHAERKNPCKTSVPDKTHRAAVGGGRAKEDRSRPPGDTYNLFRFVGPKVP